MATSTDTKAAARWDLPVELIERGVGGTLRLRLYRSGAAAPPAAATVSVYQGTTALIDEETATIADGEARYTYLAAVFASVGLGIDYRVVWTADGETYDIPCAVVRRIVYPTVTDVDIRRRWPYLDSGTLGAVTREATWQGLIDDAWLTIQHRLMENGRYPWRVLSPSSLREPHLLLSGSRIHDALAARGNTVMAERAMQLHGQYEIAFGRVPLDYDEDEDGELDDDKTRISGRAAVWLGGAPRRRYWSHDG